MEDEKKKKLDKKNSKNTYQVVGERNEEDWMVIEKWEWK